MTSYQRRKREIAFLEQRNMELVRKITFFQKAIWEARKATGENLGVEPFSDLCGHEESPIISDRDGLMEIIRELPLIYLGPGVKSDDFVTGDEEVMDFNFIG